MQTVVETPDFISDAKRLLTEAERWALIAAVSKDPIKGNLIVGTGGARKIRWARPNEGKSGGYRVVYYYCGEDVPIFMLAIFAKNERVNLSKAERNELANILADIADAYRNGVRTHAKGRKQAD